MVAKAQPAMKDDLDLILDEKVKEVPKPSKVGVEMSPLSQQLDQASNLLLDQLQPSIRDFAKELAAIQLHIPLWHLIIGAVLSQYESGTLSAPSIDPSWQYEPPSMEPKKCEVCGELFQPTKFGQRFCSHGCGLVWDKEFGRGAKRKG